MWSVSLIHTLCLTRSRSGIFIFQLQQTKLNAGLTKHPHSQIVRIALGEIYFRKLAVDEHLGTNKTGLRGAVQLSPGQGYSMHSSLDNHILFGMQPPAEFMPLPGWDLQFFPQASLVQTMGQPGRSAVVSSAQDTLVLDRHRPHLAPQAGRPLGHEKSDAHEVFRPGQSMIHEKNTL